MDLLFPLLILFMIGLLFFSSRQRRKQASQQESLQNALTVGDVVVMTSGISGTVVDTDDERTIDVEIAPDVVTTWLRAAVREKLVADAEHVEDLDDATGHDAVAAPTATTTPTDAVGTGGTPSAPSTASTTASGPAAASDSSASGSSAASGTSGSSVQDTGQTSSPRSS